MKNLLVVAALILSLPCQLRAQQADQENSVSYSKDIEPIFRRNCQGCHQPAKAQGEFDMTSFEALLQAGESDEPSIVPGKPEASYLMEQITPHEGQAAMPKKAEPLSDADRQLIRRWIAEGAQNDSPPSPPKYDAENPPKYSRPSVITTLEFSPDGKWLAISGFHEVLLVSVKDWKLQKRFIGLSERIESVSFSPDSSRLAVTGGSPGRLGEVQIWNVATAELLLSHQVTFDTVYGGCFSPDGKLVAFGCSDNTVRAIDAKSGEQKLHQGAHDDWIRACVFNPDGTHLVSAGRDMTVKLTEVATERFVDNVTSITPGALRGGVNSLAMHPERDEVLVGGADGIPKVYRIFRETQRRIGDDANLIRKFPAMTGRIFGVALSPDGKLFAATSTLDGKSEVQVYPYDFAGELPDDVKAAMAKRVQERSAEEKKLVTNYTSQTSAAVATASIDDSSLYAVAFAKDSKKIAVGGSDGLVRILDAQNGKLLTKFSPVELTKSGEESGGGGRHLLAGNGLVIPSSSTPNPETEQELIPKSKLVKLQVEPAEIVLESEADYVQLTVTAEYASGQTFDATRLSRKSSAESNIELGDLGLVMPRSNGDSELKISFGGLSETIPVKVSLNEHLPTDFVRNVNPILSRLGCNAGTCHGAQKGKKGFKLSLRGYDPLEDVRALSDDLGSRRLNTAAPDASLMLLKPIGAVPHEGGVLLDKNSVHYETLRQWIAGGGRLDQASKRVARIEVTPARPVIEREGAWQQFRVVAHYPDGSAKDVTQEAFIETGNAEVCKSYAGGRVNAIRRGEAPILARYEGAYAAATVTVMGDRSGFAWGDQKANSTIDRLVADKWQRMKILPSDLCQDDEFLRRVRLDLTGLPPTADELRKFLDDPRPSKLKRQAKIDELIGSKDYVDHWTNKWADLLQVNSKFIGKDGAKALRDWIRKSVDENQPYNDFAHEILTAQGSNKENPAASYYKILRDPDLIMENTTHLFLAIRFNCNKCHDHPFERWTQDQYYELAAFFAQTALKKDPASGNQKIGGTAVEGAKPLYEEVYENPKGEMTHARTGDTVAPAFPFDCDYDVAPGATRREELAAWITSRDNPYFARSMVNRLWGYLTGTGLMEPLDDIRAGNPPTNPELLDHLTREFIESDFDVEHILRLICNSRTYQLSVASNQWNVDDVLNYSHAKARRLPAEVLYDAVYHVTGAVTDIPGVAPGTRAAELPDVAVSLPDGFLKNLGRPVRESACECERSDGLQLGPVMALVSGPTIGKAISDPKCALPKLAEEDLGERELIREIYLRVLSREATEEEVDAIAATAQQISVDHERMKNELAALEAWWTDEKQRRETKRLADLESTQVAIVEREKAIAPDRKRMEEERLKKLASAEKALEEYAGSAKTLANKYLNEQSNSHNWFPLIPHSLNASNKATLMVQPDRSIVAAGKADKGTYVVQFRTPLKGIRGFRLEALPHAIKGGGPGLPENGNFVVTEIEVDAAPASKPKEKKRIAISAGKADFSQVGFAPEQVFDGQTRNQKGWAVNPRGGSVHWATFQFKSPVELEEETLLTFTIHQFHNAADHRLAHFRISVTTDEGELQLGLPEAFATLASTPETNRTDEHLNDLLTFLEKSDAEWTKLRTAVADARKPLPEDEQLVSLRNRAKALETETPDAAKVVQLRKDFAASQAQVKNQRLTLAQDLTWALINSPAFLFNH